jgi:hypothetical protein
MMPKNIFTTHLCTILVAILALFAAQTVAANGELGDGICDELEANLFQCFEDAGYVVEILPCNGQFPCLESGNSVFNYRITEVGTKKIQFINLLLPAMSDLEILSSTPARRKLFRDGRGDKISKFGRGLTFYNTLRLWKHNYHKKKGDISLTLRGDIPALHNAMGLIISLDWRKWAIGEILLPGGLPAENEQVLGKTFFKGVDFDWNLIFNAAGLSVDVECPNDDCTITTLQLGDIEFSSNGNGEEPAAIKSSSETPSNGFLDSLPFDQPFVAGDSPGCTYVRTRSGGVKRMCP